MEIPELSIIVPAHNAGGYLQETIESVRALKGIKWECLIINDRSTDGSLDFLNALKDPRIIRMNSEKPGPTGTRNTGLFRATGRYVRFLDADDWLISAAVPEQIAHIQDLEARHAKATSVGWFLSRNCDTGDECCVRQRVEPESAESLIKYNTITGALLHRREDLLAIEGFDESLPFVDEYDLHVRLALSGVQFGLLELPVFIQRLHSAPHRLSNRSYRSYGVELWLSITANHIQLAKADSGELSLGLRRAFAWHYWEIGRCFLRDGVPEASQQCFSLAREMAPVRAGRWLYQILSRGLGPVRAEWLLSRGRTQVSDFRSQVS